MLKQKNYFYLAILVFLIVIAFSSASYADSPGNEKEDLRLPATTAYNKGGSHEHDGFYLRMQLGFANARSKRTGYSDIPDLEVSGSGTTFRIDIGGAIKENLILFGVLGGISIQDPDVKKDTFSGTMKNTTYSINDVGVGLTYYIMPANIFLGGSFNIAKIKADIGIVEGVYIRYESDSVCGLYLNIGKEWWVSDNWGLGVGGFGYFGEIPGDDGTIKNTAFGLFFSATYN